MKEIKYIGFYSINNSKNKRYSALSATNKMDYVCDALNKAGYKVHLISAAWFNDTDKIAKYQSQNTVKIGEFKRLTLCPSFGTKIKILGAVKIGLSLTWLFFWLLFNTKRNEKILVYHSTILSTPIRYAKLIIGFKIILEIEEIYSKVWKTSSLVRNLEEKIIKKSESYIVASETLDEISKDKPKVILYGSYNLPVLYNHGYQSNNCNLVYAGAIEFIRGGAFNSIKCMEFLPNNHILHILGFGNKDAINKITEEIISVNSKLKREACIFHGIKTGADFERLMSTFSIGLNPQREGDYMDSAFPSKILMYLSYNLRVVSSKIKSIENSKISSLVTFTLDDTPQSIAASISSLDYKTSNNSRNIILQLDIEFVEELKYIFLD